MALEKSLNVGVQSPTFTFKKEATEFVFQDVQIDNKSKKGVDVILTTKPSGRITEIFLNSKKNAELRIQLEIGDSLDAKAVQGNTITIQKKGASTMLFIVH